MTEQLMQNQWQDMLRRSWEPRQWFFDDLPSDVEGEAKIMWVIKPIRQGEDVNYEVGYFTPDKEWVPDDVFPTRQQARVRTNFLNGGRQQL